MQMLEGLNLHIAGVRALRGLADRNRRVESALLAAHLGGYLAVVFTFLPPALAVAFIAVQQGLFGLHVGCAFAPNHKGMPILRRDEELDFLRRQVLTWRNVPRGRPLVDQELRSAISTPAAGCGFAGRRHLLRLDRAAVRRLDSR